MLTGKNSQRLIFRVGSRNVLSLRAKTKMLDNRYGGQGDSEWQIIPVAQSDSLPPGEPRFYFRNRKSNLTQWDRPADLSNAQLAILLSRAGQQMIMLRPTASKPTFRVMAVEGPVNLTQHYSAKYGKMVYIFGDLHFKSGKGCATPSGASNIAQFLKTVIDANPDKMIDIFLEMKLLARQRAGESPFPVYMEQGFMFGDVRQQWEACLQVDKELCVFRNLRMHYTDPRHAKAVGLLLRLRDEDLTNLMEKLQWRLQERLPFDEDDAHSMAIQIKDIDAKLNEIGSISNLDDAIQLFKIDKQIAAIPNASVRQAIQTHFLQQGWFNPVFRVTPDEIRAVLSPWRQEKPLVNQLPKQQDINALIDRVINRISRWTLTLMDAYMMARLFRIFAGQTGRYSEEPRFGIIYAGNTHATEYRNFLDKILGFERVASTGSFLNAQWLSELMKMDRSQVSQCIDLSPFPQPFFQDERSKFISSSHLRQSLVQLASFPPRV